MRGDEDEVEAPPSALHNQLVEQRDDLGLWSVYADQLQRDEDPRGALVSLMMERERTPSLRLYEAEVAYRAKHKNRLLPRALRRHADSVVWRRGFPVGIPVPSLAVLECTSPTLAFVDTGYVQATYEDWDAWLAALAQRPWRRLRIELAGASEDDELALEPLFAAVPQLEHLQLVFPEYENPRVMGGGSAPRLRHLAIDNAATLTGLGDIEAPELADLRLLTATQITDDFVASDLCAQLQQIVASDVAMLDGAANVMPHVRIDRDESYGEYADAFIVIGQLVDASLIEDAARDLRGLTSLAVDVGHVVASELTAVRLRSFGDANLLPYGFAITLANELAPATPLALLHESERTGITRGFTPATGMRREAARGADVLRALLDHQRGRDPGADVLADVQEALECGTQRAIFGTSTSSRMPVLSDIDPNTLGPLPEIDDPDFQEPVPDHEVELYSAPVATKIVVEEVEEVAVASDDDEIDDSDDEIEEIVEAKLSTDTVPDGRDAWLRLLATWEDRELDELTTVPPVDEDADFDVEAAPADASVCQDCEQANVVTYACVWCGGHHCAACSIKPETGGIWCNHCIKDLAAARSADPLSPRAYDDEVFDAEVAEDAAELRALQRPPTIDDDYDQDEWA